MSEAGPKAGPVMDDDLIKTGRVVSEELENGQLDMREWSVRKWRSVVVVELQYRTYSITESIHHWKSTTNYTMLDPRF